MNVALIGATGHVGSKILAEALSRGHKVTAICRHPEAVPLHPNVTAVKVDIFDTPALGRALAGHMAAITAFSPGRGEMGPEIYDKFVAGHKAVIAGIKASDVRRVLAVGGAASLKLPSGEALIDSAEWPEQFYKPAVLGTRELMYLLKAEPELDWVFLSPPTFLEPGERTGRYQLGKDHLLFAPDGRSHISEEDYAVAMVDELERPAHHRERFTVGY